MSKSFNKILIVDDDEDVLLAARLLLKQHAVLVHTEKDPQMIPNLLKNETYDIILLDMNFSQDATSGREGFHWLGKILQIDPSAVVILITAFGGVETAVQAIKEGATDFVLKPWQNEKLLATLSAAAKLRQSRLEVDHLRSRQKQLSEDLDQQVHNLISAAPAMQDIFIGIRKVAQTDADVLILGENGTGKELVARALHRQSSRSDEVFLGVDMGAVSETLFLDEIGNLSLPLQAKLLAVLENRTVTRLGANKPTPIDVRLICATNMPIQDMVAKNEFRQDLLYRINTVELHLPPLRDRKEDILLLTDHFLEIYCKKYQKPLMRIQPTTLEKLDQYAWPGNIRELQHAIERAIIMNDGRVLQPTDFLLSTPGIQDEKGLAFEDYNLEKVEKTVIRKAIEKHHGNISQAARELGLTRSALYRRLEKYGL